MTTGAPQLSSHNNIHSKTVYWMTLKDVFKDLKDRLSFSKTLNERKSQSLS